MLRSRFGLAQGFDVYEDSLFREKRRWYLKADEVFEAAASWLRDTAEQPFFLWVHFSDPHEPYQAGEIPPNARLTLDGNTVGEWDVINKERYLTRFRLPPGRHTLTWTSLREPRPDDTGATGLVLRFLRTADLEQWLVEGSPDLKEEHGISDPLEMVLENPGTETVDVFHMFTGKLEHPPPSEVLAAYDEEVAFTDAHLGKLESTLEELGIADDTLWIIASDHGEGLFNHQILGHAVYVQEDHLRMVWMMRGPGVPAGHRETRAEALSADVLPTVLDLLGLPAPDGIRGASRVPCWDSECSPRREWWGFGASAEDQRVTAVAGYRWPYKVLWQPEPASGCFDLDQDPSEDRDLCPTGALGEGVPRELSLLERDLRTRLVELQRTLDGVDEEQMEQDAREAEEILRSLGYVGN